MNLKKTFGLVTSLGGLILLFLDIKEFAVVSYLSDDTYYLGVKPLSVRITQWIYLCLLVLAGYFLIKGNNKSWHIYQVAGLTILIERSIIYFAIFELFYGKSLLNFFIPLLAGASILLFTNQKDFLAEFNLSKKNIHAWFLKSVLLAIFFTLLPKYRFLLYEM